MSELTPFSSQQKATPIPVETARALVRSEQSSQSSNSQDVMDRLQKRDLSIFKTGDKSSTSDTITSDTIDLETGQSVVNIKEEAPVEAVEVIDPETQFSVENDSNSQFDFEQVEYDESYAGKYGNNQHCQLLPI